MNDNALFAAIGKLGFTASDLFLVAGKIYASPDANLIDARSTYKPVMGLAADTNEALVGLLRRLDRPEYSSIEAIETLIQDGKDWESLYSGLNAMLDRYGRRDGGDFLVVEDDYGYRQQKIECVTPGWFGPEMIQLIQAMLERFRDGWEVIVFGEGADHKPFSLSIYKDAVVPRSIETHEGNA